MQTCSIVDYRKPYTECETVGMSVCPRPSAAAIEAVAKYGEAKVVRDDGSTVTFWNNGTIQIRAKDGVFWTWTAKPTRKTAAIMDPGCNEVTTFFDDGAVLVVSKWGHETRWPSDAEAAALPAVEGELLDPNHFHDGWPCYNQKEVCGTCDEDIAEFDCEWRELTCPCGYVQ